MNKKEEKQKLKKLPFFKSKNWIDLFIFIHPGIATVSPLLVECLDYHTVCEEKTFKNHVFQLQA